MSTETHVAEPQLNATPLIDVLLVLIVTLVISIPIATHAVKLDMPSAAPPTAIALDRVYLTIDFDGVITLDGKPAATIELLENRLRDLQRRIPAPEIWLEADARVAYDPVAQVLAATQRARIKNLRIGNLSRL